MRTRGPIFGAFNQGELPKIACFNKTTVALEDRRGHRSEQRATKKLRCASEKEITRAERKG